MSIIPLLETHPFEPFLPPQANLLMMGSFPPQKKRWSMDFYYPNLNNDMWRIMGLIFFNDKDYFLTRAKKGFCRERIVDVLSAKGIALHDTASVICRLQNTASDKFLNVTKATDIGGLLRQLPQCKAVATTGQKATDTFRLQFEVPEPKTGSFSEFFFEERSIRLYRMPSTSRAYPLKLEKKAAIYYNMLHELQIIPETFIFL